MNHVHFKLIKVWPFIVETVLVKMEFVRNLQVKNVIPNIIHLMNKKYVNLVFVIDKLDEKYKQLFMKIKKRNV